MCKFTLTLSLFLFLPLLPHCAQAQHQPLSRSDQYHLNFNFLIYAMMGSPTYVKDLVENGANIEYADKEGERALDRAARAGAFKNVKALLALGAKVDARDKSGRTALFYAVEAVKDKVNTINALFDGGAQINTTDHYGDTPLKLALLATDEKPETLELVNFLKSHGARDPLVEAAFNGDLATLPTLLANSNAAQGLAASSAMEVAILREHLDVLKLFLSHHANPNARNREGQTLLIQAAKIGNLAMVKALLARKATIDAHDRTGYTALMSVGGDDFKKIFPLLRERGANIDARDRAGQTMLIHATWQILPALSLPFLLEQGANPNLRDNRGDTALIQIASWTQEDMVDSGKEESHAAAVKILMDRGADVNARGADGMTALMRAAGWHHPPTVKALLACGANVDIQDDLGRTALTWAARGGQKSAIVQDLLNAGAQFGLTEALLLDDFPKAREILAAGGDTTDHGPYGETLLMIAAEKGQSDIVQSLLKRGADVNARDTNKETALMLAIGGRAIHWMPSGIISWDVKTVEEPRMQIIKALLARHANPNFQNDDILDNTALSIAQEINLPPVIALLTHYGAKGKVINNRPFYLAPHTPNPERNP